MQIEETKEVTSKQKVVVGHKCDICNKISKGKIEPESWHCFSSGHQSWGNDSIESIEWYLVCSPECYIEAIKVSIKDVADYQGAEIDEMTGKFAVLLIDYIGDK